MTNDFPDLPIEEFLAKRDRALRTLDLKTMKALLGNHDIPDDIALIGAHKARYECTAIESHLRLESGEWLRAHGHKRMFGLDLLPQGMLPK